MTGLVVFLVTLGVGLGTFAVVNACQRFGIHAMLVSYLGSLMLKVCVLFTAWAVMSEVVASYAAAILAGIFLVMMFEVFWWWRTGALAPLYRSGAA